MSVPGVTVEIGFDTGGAKQSLGTVYDDVVWTDVTQYVRAKEGVVFSRGRAEAGQAAAAGQLTISFDNSDGRFTPGTTGGPYGQVHTRMPIKVTGYQVEGGTGTGPFDSVFAAAEFDAIVAAGYTLWLGFITDIDWKVEGGQPVVAMSASDVIAAAARTRCGPWLTKRVTALSPSYYWPLTDTAPNSATNNTATAVPALEGETARALVGDPLTVAGATAATLSFNVTSDVSPDPTIEPVFAFTPASGAGKWLIGRVTLPASGDFALSMWVRPTDAAGGVLYVATDNSSAVREYFRMSNDGSLEAGDVLAGTGAKTTWTGLTADTWSHLYLERDNSATAPASRYRLWVNGSERTGTATSTFSTDPSAYHDVTIGGTGLGGVDDFNGQLAHVAVWTTLDTTRAVFLANNGGAGAQTCAGRIAELHYLTPNPAGLSTWLSADATATNTVSAQAAANKSLLQVCEEAADAERGSIIATREGKLRLLAQRYLIAPASVSATLSAESDIMALANTFGVDDSANLSECAVTLQPSGWRYTATREVDPGVESTTLDVWSIDQYFAEALARQIANADTEKPRAPSLTLSMEWLTYVGLADSVMPLELGDTIRVTDLPSQAPETALTLQIRTIGHAITAAGWQVTIDTDPPLLGAVLDDAARGVLNQTAYLGV